MKALGDSTKEYFLTYSKLYRQQASPTWFMSLWKNNWIWSEEIYFLIINPIDMADRWQLDIGNGFCNEDIDDQNKAYNWLLWQLSKFILI